MRSLHKNKCLVIPESMDGNVLYRCDGKDMSITLKVVLPNWCYVQSSQLNSVSFIGIVCYM